ncbi:MAG: hypothetical protein SWK90_09135 [Chloroflexota bacterium]|nr:hypothetical protein [Chloroflexota bacterium]
MEAVKYILAIYSWIVVGILIVFLWRIAYFYEKTSGHHVGHYVLLLPSLLLAVGVVWYLTHGGKFIGEFVADMFLLGGGVLLCLFGFRLQGLMTGERR